MSDSQNSTPTDTPQAVQNGFNTFMALRHRGVDINKAFRAADHVRRATNERGDEGATSAAVQVLRWLGLFVGVVIIVLAIVEVGSAAAPAQALATTPANMIHLPVVAQRCNPCSHSIQYPTPTATPFINEPPMPTEAK